MDTRAWLAAIGGLLTVTACGGNVVVDPAGAGGAGGGGPGPDAVSNGSYTTGSYTTGSYTTGSYTTGSYTTGSYTTGSYTTGSYTSSYVSSTSTGPYGCDDSGDCGACQECSINGPCNPAVEDCLNNAECMAILDCFQYCTDDACYQQCWEDHPGGQQSYGALADCVLCQTCPASCGGC